MEAILSSEIPCFWSFLTRVLRTQWFVNFLLVMSSPASVAIVFMKLQRPRTMTAELLKWSQVESTSLS